MSSSQRSTSARWRALASALADKPIFWLAFIVMMFTWPILRSIHAERALPRERPIVGAVRGFTLGDQNGEAFGASELRGRVWVASFAVVNCEPTCVQSERVLKTMDRLRRRTRNLGDAIRLVTFAIDPEGVTTAPMLELAATYRARRGPWRFVSGPPARIRDILSDFHVAEGPLPAHVVLVDGELSIRGHYAVDDEAALGLLLRDVSLLLSRGD